MAFEVMLDIETLATTADAMVLSVAMVPFNSEGVAIPGKALYFRLDQVEQAGRWVDPLTLKWWALQDTRVLQEAFGADQKQTVIDGPVQTQKWGGPVLSLDRFTDALIEWAENLGGISKVWSKGPHFDGAILDSLLEDRPKPWTFRHHRDCRTMEDLLEPDDWKLLESYHEKGDSHHPIDDCLWQIAALRFARIKLGRIPGVFLSK